MKKKKITIGILCLTIVLGGAIYLLYQGVWSGTDNSYDKLPAISVNEFFEKEKEYYVYAQRAGCPYCDNVKDEILEFAKHNQLFVLNTRAKGNEGIKDYDWDKHHKLYDKEIGKVVDGKMVFLNGLTEKNLEDEYSPLDYSIKKADKDFVELNAGKEEGKIYAIREAPIIDYTNVTDENLIIPAVPMLFHIRDGKVESYYYGDTQIINFMGGDKKPLDDYIS